MAGSAVFPNVAGPKMFHVKSTSTDACTFTILDNSSGQVSVKVDALSCCTTNTSAANNTLTIYVYDGAVQYAMGCVLVPTGAGTGGVNSRCNAINAIGTSGPDGVPCIWVEAGKRLDGRLSAGMPSTDYCTDITGRYITYD